MPANGATSEPVYNVVWPLGPSAYKTRAPEPRIADLNGKTIGELWDYLFRGEDIFPLVRAQLKARFPGIKFVTYDVFGNVHGPQQRARPHGLRTQEGRHEDAEAAQADPEVGERPSIGGGERREPRSNPGRRSA